MRHVGRSMVGLLIGAVVMTSCGQAEEGGSAGPGSSGAAQAGLTYAEVMALAIGEDGQPGDIDGFWRRTLPLMDPMAVYQAPTDFVGYQRGVAPANDCGRALQRNAYYCPDDGSIAWEIEFFQERQRSIGDLAPLVIMAHEWGHRIQATWRETGTRRRAEAQADCYSGVYVSDAIDRGIIVDADFQETIETWYGWGATEYEADSWFSESDHGPGQARAWAFISGYLTGDPVYCVSFERYEPSAPQAYPGYTLRVPPGTTLQSGEVTGQAYDALIGERASGYVWARPNLPAEPDASAQLPDIADTWFDGTARQIDVVDAFGETLGGSGAILRFEQTVTLLDGSTTPFHGVLALHVGVGGGGIIIEAYRPGAAPADDAGWEPIGDYLYLLMSGLCPAGARTYICTRR